MTSMLIAAAISGIVSAAQGDPTQGPAFQADISSRSAEALDDSKGKHSCKGKNACKGQGGCKTDTHACKGQNACKGKGGCKG